MKAFVLLYNDYSFLSAHSSIRKAEAAAREFEDFTPAETTIREIDLNSGDVIADWDYDINRGCFVCSFLNQ